jgi:uncharacterized protein (DUF3084 family)
MNNDEIERIMNFLIHRQEVFAENQEKMQTAIVRLTEAQATLTKAQANLADAQAQTQRDFSNLSKVMTQTQQDISNLSKIVSGLVEIVMERRNGGS